MDRVPVFILSGGRCSRFGGDKACAEVDGEALIVKVAQSLQPVASSLTVVAEHADKYRHLGLKTIGDLKPGLGPLGGIHTALRHEKARDWILCASCDRIGLKPGWLEHLLEGRTDGAGVVAFRGSIWQPLPALYHVSAGDRVKLSLRKGNLAPWRLIQRLDPVALPLPPDWDASLDINDPHGVKQWRG